MREIFIRSLLAKFDDERKFANEKKFVNEKKFANENKFANQSRFRAHEQAVSRSMSLVLQADKKSNCDEYSGSFNTLGNGRHIEVEVLAAHNELDSTMRTRDIYVKRHQ